MSQPGTELTNIIIETDFNFNLIKIMDENILNNIYDPLLENINKIDNSLFLIKNKKNEFYIAKLNNVLSRVDKKLKNQYKNREKSENRAQEETINIYSGSYLKKIEEFDKFNSEYEKL